MKHEGLKKGKGVLQHNGGPKLKMGDKQKIRIGHLMDKIGSKTKNETLMLI